jgi:hypothetical protein
MDVVQIEESYRVVRQELVRHRIRDNDVDAHMQYAMMMAIAENILSTYVRH